MQCKNNNVIVISHDFSYFNHLIFGRAYNSDSFTLVCDGKFQCSG